MRSYESEFVEDLLVRVVAGDAYVQIIKKNVLLHPDDYTWPGGSDMVRRELLRHRFEVEVVQEVDWEPRSRDPQARYEFSERMACFFGAQADEIKATLSGDARPDSLLRLAEDAFRLIFGELDVSQATELAKRAKKLGVRVGR